MSEPHTVRKAPCYWLVAIVGSAFVVLMVILAFWWLNQGNTPKFGACLVSAGLTILAMQLGEHLQRHDDKEI